MEKEGEYREGRVNGNGLGIREEMGEGLRKRKEGLRKREEGRVGRKKSKAG